MRSPEQERAKALLAERIATISGSEFIDQHVYGSLPEFANGRSRDGEINIETIQNDGTGAATLEYTLDGSERDFAKLFKDDLGPHSYNLMRGLWDAGFDEQQHYQVPEPLFFMEELNMILMRAARGTCLADVLRADVRDTEMAINGVRGSAKWLVRMHAAPIRFGYIDQPWYVFGKLADRLSKASAAHPTEYGRLTKFIDEREIPWANLFSDDAEKTGWDHPLATHYGILGIPATILVNQQGEVVSLSARGGQLPKLLEELLGKPKE